MGQNFDLGNGSSTTFTKWKVKVAYFKENKCGFLSIFTPETQKMLMPTDQFCIKISLSEGISKLTNLCKVPKPFGKQLFVVESYLKTDFFFFFFISTDYI